MRAPFTTRAVVLQALREGAAYGRDLIRRITRTTAGQVRPSEARVYPVLHELQREGLVKAVRVVPGSIRGARSRTYYDLTLSGVKAANAERAILRSLLTDVVPAPGLRERTRMMLRVLSAEDLAELGQDLRQALCQATIRASRHQP